MLPKNLLLIVEGSLLIDGGFSDIFISNNS